MRAPRAIAVATAAVIGSMPLSRLSIAGSVAIVAVRSSMLSATCVSRVGIGPISTKMRAPALAAESTACEKRTGSRTLCHQ